MPAVKRAPPAALFERAGFAAHYNHATVGTRAQAAMNPSTRVEHRSEPRYRDLLRVRIGTVGVTTANVSLHGMQLVCPLMRFDAVKADVQGGELRAQVALPQGDPVNATLSVRYWSQHGDEVLIGVRMTVADAEAQARWAAYIGKLSGGAGPTS
jgi:hypothetical protein